jgi:hypothetical protein
VCQAVSSANTGDWAGAAKWFQQAVDKDPTQWSSWTDGSVALERAGMFAESARWLVFASLYSLHAHMYTIYSTLVPQKILCLTLGCGMPSRARTLYRVV